MLRPILSGAVFAILWTTTAVAQSSSPSEQRSTLAGVYTRDQANAGRDIYLGICQSCHTAASHTGATFANSWVGRPLSDLFAFVSEKMPKSAPGSLSPEEYASVVAQLLRLNGMPAGDDELPADTVALKRIRIEIRKTP